LRDSRSDPTPATQVPRNRAAAPIPIAIPIVAGERPSSASPIKGISVCVSPARAKKVANGAAAIATSSERAGIPAGVRASGTGAAEPGSRAPAGDLPTAAWTPPGLCHARHTSTTATPTAPETAIAGRQPVTAPNAPPSAGPAI
jgi:hypothetical protein